MDGVLNGLRVLDLSWGISGPIAGMLLADHGADVIKIDPPDGDPFESTSGYQVWCRGKRRASLDLRDEKDHERFLALASRADVVIESWSPGTAERLGIGAERLIAANPRLVHCSITAYGADGPDADRPGLDALVAARSGLQWEVRGVEGGTIARLAGAEIPASYIDVPEGGGYGPDRPGPLFSAVPWPSMAAAYQATLGISAALYVRATEGHGQRVETSLLQGVLAATVFPWQRVTDPDAEHYQSWVIDPRASKGFYKASDDRWVHQWPMLPNFVNEAGAGEELVVPAELGARIALDPDEMVLIHHYRPELAAVMARHASAGWSEVAAKAGAPLQPVRSPEEALLDPALVADGCVAEVEDGDLGAVRQVGVVYELAACPQPALRPPVAAGHDTEAVLAEADEMLGSSTRADAARRADAPPPTVPGTGTGSGPLAGVTVLDLGLAVAGPFGTQLLGDLGAEVIKVNAPRDDYWHRNHLGMSCNRSKRSITVDLKSPEGLAILHRLVSNADVVHHNMRYEAARRLGVDYDSLKELNPSLIYCHTRGHDRGPRETQPGNDQTAAAITGVEWIDGGVDDGGEPLWPVVSLGDTGNGFLSAIAVTQALFHRARTGEGQFVSTAIINAHLLNLSSAWTTPDGSAAGKRPALDAELRGTDAFYSLYEAEGGWICIAATDDDQRRKLASTLGLDLDLDLEAGRERCDARTLDRRRRRAIAEAIRLRPVREIMCDLDHAGVPCEISNHDGSVRIFDDRRLRDKGWIVGFDRRDVGHIETAGSLIDFSSTSTTIRRPALVPGEDTRSILTELGFRSTEVEDLLARRIVVEAKV